MQYVIEDEYIIDLDVQLRQLPEVDMEIVLPVIVEQVQPNVVEVGTPVVTYTSSNAIEVETAFSSDVDYVGGISINETDITYIDNPQYISKRFTGLTPATKYTFNGVGLAVMGQKAYGPLIEAWTSASPIPTEYQLVEYLRSDTNQFIFLDYIPNGISHWFIDLVSISGDNQQCGVSSTSSSDRYVIANSGGSLYIGMGGGIQTGINITGSRTKIKLLPDQNKYEINGVSYNFASSFVGEVYKLCLFARNVGGSPQFGMSSMFYYSYIEELGEKKLDMYPVYRKSDNKPGIYDIVNNQFYVNQGTGEFTVGPDKEWDE